MRFFNKYLTKNIIWIYLCVLICFSYITLMNAIPDHIYLEEGENLSLNKKIPVNVALCAPSTEAMSDVGLSTYAQVRERKTVHEVQNLSVGSYEMICYLFGIFPIKEVSVSVVDSTKVFASGHIVGIYGKTDGVFVLGSSPIEVEDGSYVQPAEHVLFPGDYILSVDGMRIYEKEELMEQIQLCDGNPLILTVARGGDTIEVSVQPVAARSTQKKDIMSYMLGIWVKDDMAGIGTMTYADRQGNFGALGHGISDGETGNPLKLSSGSIYEAHILGVKKGRRGDPGELQGVVKYGKKNLIGELNSNTEIGIYGKLSEDYSFEYNSEYIDYDMMSLAYKQDVKEGDAYIISEVSGQREAYHIVIDSIEYSPVDRNKGIRFHVDDERLLALTGGIIQGLSGSPIIQDDKLIGGVTHVLINDPTKGYGIFIETMLESKNKI